MGVQYPPTTSRIKKDDREFRFTSFAETFSKINKPLDHQYYFFMVELSPCE